MNTIMRVLVLVVWASVLIVWGRNMEKIHLVFVRDVLKEAIAKSNSDFILTSKLNGVLDIVRDEIASMPFVPPRVKCVRCGVRKEFEQIGVGLVCSDCGTK